MRLEHSDISQLLPHNPAYNLAIIEKKPSVLALKLAKS